MVRQLLVLSHGQASVKRGFSVNKESSEYSLSKESLIAHRHTIQAVHEHGGPHKVPITKELLVECSSARSKYYQYLEEKAQKKAEHCRGEKRKAAQEDVDSLKAKKARVEADISSLINKADRFFEETEEKECLRLISEANALRAKAKAGFVRIPIYPYFPYFSF